MTLYKTNTVGGGSSSQSNKKKRILLGTLTTLGVLVMTGVGIGIGWVIGHKPPSPIFSFSTTQPLLTNVGDEFEVHVTTNNSSQKTFCMEIDDTYDELFDGTTPFLRFTGSNYIHSTSETTTFHEAPFINKKATFIIECLKPLTSSEDTQFISYHLLHFNVNNELPNYSQFSHFIFQSNISIITPEEINNFTFRFKDEWPTKPDSSTFLTWLQSNQTFSQYLPNLPTNLQIEFNSNDNEQTVLDKLHMFDNSVSMLEIIIADVYCSFNNHPTRYDTALVNVFGLIGTTESNRYGQEQQKFDLAFQQKGDSTDIRQEILNDIFMANNKAIGNNWQMVWDSWLHYNLIDINDNWNDPDNYDWVDQGGSTGTFTGMIFAGDNGRKSIIKAIYHNIVKNGGWPTGW